MNQDYEQAVDRAVRVHVARANAGTWDGKTPTPYFNACRMVFRVTTDLTVVGIFTRDVNHHLSGWWKNPDYERCRHLSLSFRFLDQQTGQLHPVKRHVGHTKALLEKFFGARKDSLWCEPPYSDQGKQYDVWHYRLFCDPAWEPIKPRGEVYSKEFTESGWLSYSDVRAFQVSELERAGEIVGNLNDALSKLG